MKNVKITVIKKEFYSEFAEEYLADGKAAGPCPILNVGDEFIYEGGAQMPAGFCPWAWIDLYRGISMLSAEGITPWYRKNGSQILCCTDGVRPVVFRVEAIENDCQNG